MPPENPYAAPQSLRPGAGRGVTPVVVDFELLPVIQAAGVCSRALLGLVATAVGSVLLGLIFWGGTERLFALLALLGFLSAGLAHLWGVARLTRAPRAAGVGLLFMFSCLLGALFLLAALPWALYLAWLEQEQFLALAGWLAAAAYTGSALLLLLGIERLGEFTNQPRIRLYSRLALVCLVLAGASAVLFAVRFSAPELLLKLGILEPLVSLNFISVGIAAALGLVVIMGLAFYGTALQQLMQLGGVLQGVQREVPPQFEDE